MSRRLLFVTAIVSVLLARPLWAAQARATREALQEHATHIVTGKVVAIYQRITADDSYKHLRYVAEIVVDECEKGEGIQRGDRVSVWYWQEHWIGRGYPPPNGTGNDDLPTEQESVRVYLQYLPHDDDSWYHKPGGYNVITPNGFETLPSASMGQVVNVAAIKAGNFFSRYGQLIVGVLMGVVLSKVISRCRKCNRVTSITPSQSINLPPADASFPLDR